MNRVEILKAAKKKRSLSVRDFWYYDLEEMVHEGSLNKTFPKGGRVHGWPAYTITKRGRKSLVKDLRKEF